MKKHSYKKMQARGQRATGESYRQLPAEQRTAFVVGMCEMLQIVALYTEGESKENIDKMLDYEGQFSDEDLRVRFDGYVSAKSASSADQASGLFFRALYEWCN
jgi:hypothetical protein